MVTVAVRTLQPNRVKYAAWSRYCLYATEVSAPGTLENWFAPTDRSLRW